MNRCSYEGKEFDSATGPLLEVYSYHPIEERVLIKNVSNLDGTEYYEMAKHGYGGLKLLTHDWREFRRWGNAVINVNDLTKEELIKWQKRALLEFYLRPRIIWYNLRRAGIKAAVKNVHGFVKSFVKKKAA